MDEQKQQELAEQIGEVYERLQQLTMAMTPDNAEIMSCVYGQLRYVYQGLTETGGDAAEKGDGENVPG